MIIYQSSLNIKATFIDQHTLFIKKNIILLNSTVKICKKQKIVEQT